MPFKSEKQRRYLWANHPDIARRWANEEKSMSDEEAAALNEHVKKKQRKRKTNGK